MGKQHIATLAAVAAASVRSIRCFNVGSGANQRGPRYSRHPLAAGIVFCSEVRTMISAGYSHGSVIGETKTILASKLGPPLGVRSSLCVRAFCQTVVQLAKDPSQSAGGKKKRSAISAADSPSHSGGTHLRPIVFECTVCRAVCVTRILKDPYERGITILRCMDCRSVKLISDQLGLFKEPGSMQRFLRERGVDVRNGPEGRYELTPEDIASTQERTTP